MACAPAHASRSLHRVFPQTPDELFDLEEERESIYRQYETARQALMGKTPPDHTLLFQRGPVPIPMISGQQYFTTLEDLQKNFELCEDYFKTPFGPLPEIRGRDSRISMRYSVLYHACPWAKELPIQFPEGGVSSRPGSGASESDVEALTALHIPSASLDKTAAQHKRHSLTVSCPGSNTKPTLPPIPHGHRETSAASSVPHKQAGALTSYFKYEKGKLF